MTQVKGGGIRRYIELGQVYTQYLGAGLIATSGVQYSAIATFGTTPVTILEELIDPGYNLKLNELKVSFVETFTNLKDTIGSLTYYIQARSEYVAPTPTMHTVTGAYVNISGSYTKGVGSLEDSEDTLGGYVPVATLPYAPVRVKLVATGLIASSMYGKVKNTSYVKLTGTVIPGT